MRRRAEANVIGGFLLIGWGGDPDAEPPEQLVTSTELREILVESDQDLRGQILWYIEHWSADLEGKWRARLVPFLTGVGDGWEQPAQIVVAAVEFIAEIVEQPDEKAVLRGADIEPEAAAPPASAEATVGNEQ